MSLKYIHLAPGQSPPEIARRPFRAVVVAEAMVGKDWRNRISDWLIERGCLYFVAWGDCCREWEDSVDWAYLESIDYGEMADESFVMTTSHYDEPLSEAFWFAGFCAYHSDIELADTIILHVSVEARETEMMQTYVDSQVESSDD